MFHLRHKWKLTALHHYTVIKGGGDVTALMFVCSDCPKRRKEVFDGKWTKEELGFE